MYRVESQTTPETNKLFANMGWTNGLMDPGTAATTLVYFAVG